MSIQSATEFRNKISVDPALQARLRESLGPGETFDVVAIGKGLGYAFSRADAEKAFQGSPGDELSDFELEMVQSATPINCNGGSSVRPDT